MSEPITTLQFLVRKLGAFMASVLVTYALAVAGATSAVVISLRGMGVGVPLPTATGMLGRDLTGMASMFLPMVAFGLLIAFMTTALIRRYLKRWPMALYILAGATAVTCIHLGLQAAFGITPIAVARSAGGLASQALAGAIGGALYFTLSSRIPRVT
jgi:hypothetical protein